MGGQAEPMEAPAIIAKHSMYTIFISGKKIAAKLGEDNWVKSNKET